VAYDETLARRVRAITRGRKDVVEKMMFGGIAFMCDGHMACGIVQDELMVRVGPERHDEMLARPHVRPMDFTGRPMRGFLYVTPAGIEQAHELQSWVELAFEIAGTAPAKPRKAGGSPRRPRGAPSKRKSRP